MKFGKQNSIEVEVKKFSENESVNFAERKTDFWLFGGIFRPVYLEAKPKENIQRVAIDAKADGSFTVDVFTSDIKKSDQIDVEVHTLDGNLVATFSEEVSNQKTSITGVL